MMAALKAELLKVLTTRAFYGLTLSAALLSAFIGFGLVAQEPPPWHLATEQIEALGGTSAIILGLFSLILGLRSFTEEFRYGTIVHTAFADPHHTRSSLAKGIVAAGGGAALSAASVMFTGLVLYAMTLFSGGSIEVTGVVAPAVGLVGGGALWAMIGVGLGALIRQPVPAMVAALLWVLVIENVAGLFIGPIARYLPSQTAQVMARGIGAPSDVYLAAGVMSVWAAALLMIGWTTIRRRDLL